jgi:T5orf172 domain
VQRAVPVSASDWPAIHEMLDPKMLVTDIQSQIVYVLTNPAMPGLVKIGKTTQLEVEDRMKQLYGTGVPIPFDCAFACQVKDTSEVEKALHFAFGVHRVNPNREFFKIEAERVIAILKLLKLDDITAQVEKTIESDIPAADIQSAQELKQARRPRMNFHELGIPHGAVLISTEDSAVTATVAGDRKVQFNGVICSLAAATRKVLRLAEDYPLQPSPYWTFNGKTVKTVYEEFHAGSDEA